MLNGCLADAIEVRLFFAGVISGSWNGLHG